MFSFLFGCGRAGVVVYALILVFSVACGGATGDVGIDVDGSIGDSSGTTDLDATNGDSKPTVDAVNMDQDAEQPEDTKVDSDGPEDTKPDEEDAEEFPICTGPGEFLCDCEENSDCVSGYCVSSPDGKVCTMKCIEDCPEGWDCKQDATSFPDPVYICLPRNVYLCRPCESDDDCGSPYEDSNNVCAPHGDNGSFCGVPCGNDGSCPDGYLCAEVQTESVGMVQQCVPEGGECECQPLFVQEGATTTCEISNTNGTCYGERGCGTDGLTECSAQVPKPEECNGIDDNCDGEIDPPNSLMCITYYLDNDGDGYGLGAGDCTCGGPPSPKHVSQGGDCDDSNVAKNPGADEVCNFEDDNCNGDIDEPGAFGCEPMYYDADGDGFGDSNNTLCLCFEDMGYVEEGGDCDDNNPDVGLAGGEEICDGVDNNCNGVIDEEGATGCIPLYIDQDGDTYGLSDQLKCLCESVGDFTATKGGDCNDANPAVHPTVNEQCDGIDNDCDGSTDEDEAVNGCGIVAHGDVVCEQGVGCVITDCEPGFFDLNSAYMDGCECQVEPGEVPNQICTEATNQGQIGDAGGQTTFTGRVVPANDEDWYKVRAFDDIDPLGCDTFHLCVRFTKNPNNAYLFDVYMGGCSGNDNLCSQSTEFSFFTDFHMDTTDPGAVGGECPCKPDANHLSTPTDYTDDTSATEHKCSEQTAWFYIKVYRKPGVALICDEYQIEVTNGASNVTCGTEDETTEF